MEAINNYELATRLDAFEKVYLEPLLERLSKAQIVLTGKDTTLTKKERERADLAFKELEAKATDFKLFLADVRKLVLQHESLVTRLSGMYSTWFSKVSYKGQQPKEMMSMQAELLQQIFTELGELLKIVHNE